tara:strand:+ start:6052 stop:7629 length:1578 start_codon:yes stop_codon:yes gene_type:complete
MSQFNPTQFGSVFNPASSLQADLANQYARDQQAMNTMQQRQEVLFDTAQRTVMTKLFSDLEQKRVERENVKAMIGRIHRAASLLGDYGVSLDDSDTDMGSGKLSDLLEEQQRRKADINKQMASLSAQAKEIERGTAQQTQRSQLLTQDFNEIASSITAESLGLAYSSGTRQAATEAITKNPAYAEALAAMARGGFTEGTVTRSKAYELSDPATRMLMALNMGDGGVDLGLEGNMTQLIIESERNEPGTVASRAAAGGLGALARIFVDEVDARVAPDEDAQLKAAVSLAASQMLGAQLDQDNPLTQDQKGRVVKILNALITGDLSQDQIDRTIADNAQGEAGDVRGYARDILSTAKSVIDQLSTSQDPKGEEATRIRKSFGRTRARLNEAASILERDIIIPKGGDGSTDIRLKGLVAPEEVLVDLRGKLQTALLTNDQSDIADALAALPSDKANKLEQVLQGLDDIEARTKALATQGEDIGVQLSALMGQEKVAGARAGELAGAINERQALEADLAGLIAQLGLED